MKLNDDYEKFRETQGFKPLAKRGKRVTRSFTISNEAHKGLMRLAQQHNCVRGDGFSLSELIERIGLGVIKC